MSPERWRELEAMYQATMDREPEVRSSYLLEACQGNEDLRRDVESLLELNGAPVLVDDPAWQAFGELLDNDTSVLIGTQLGPYQIEGVLGEGGMGRVYSARAARPRASRKAALALREAQFGYTALGREDALAAVAIVPRYNVRSWGDPDCTSPGIDQGAADSLSRSQTISWTNI